MLLTITTEHSPATDLGYLLHKYPENVRTVTFSLGDAHVFFPEASERRCTAAVVVEVEPIGLIRRRGRKGQEPFSLAGYVNDRPYAASSFLSVVVGKVFGTAMSGRCDQRPELAEARLPFEVDVPVLPRGSVRGERFRAESGYVSQVGAMRRAVRAPSCAPLFGWLKDRDWRTRQGPLR